MHPALKLHHCHHFVMSFLLYNNKVILDLCLIIVKKFPLLFILKHVIGLDATGSLIVKKRDKGNCTYKFYS